MNDSYRDDVRTAVRETRWTFFKVLPIAVVVIVILAVLGFGLNSLGLIGTKAVERKVLTTSFQYTEGTKSQIAMFEAQKASLEEQLKSPDLTPSVEANLRATLASVNVQLQAARSKQ